MSFTHGFHLAVSLQNDGVEPIHFFGLESAAWSSIEFVGGHPYLEDYVMISSAYLLRANVPHLVLSATLPDRDSLGGLIVYIWEPALGNTGRLHSTSLELLAGELHRYRKNNKEKIEQVEKYLKRFRDMTLAAITAI